MTDTAPVTQRAIAKFWAPLAMTWLIMAVEGPFLAAVIARLPAAKYNLAAYGVAAAIAMLVEAPVIMMLSASVALVDSWRTFRRLRIFAHAFNASVTTVMLVLLAPPVFNFLIRRLMGLDEQVARLVYVSLWLLVPWPAAIGYRRFYQGLLIRAGLTRRVAYGTVIRMAGMASTALLLAATTDWSGAWIGAASLSAGVCAEALASRMMAAGPRRALQEHPQHGDTLPPVPSYTQIGTFYAPLAMTSVLTMAASPMVTFFMGGAKHPLESLAVLPVVNSLVFVFRTPGVSFQEAAIALLGRGRQNLRPVLRFAFMLAATATTAFALLVWTPLAAVWFERIAGLTPDLIGFARTATRILMLMPALGAAQALERALMINVRNTRPVTGATVTELVGIVLVLWIMVRGVDLAGATAAALAIFTGRLAGTLFLLPPCLCAGSRRRAVPDGVIV